MSEMTVQASLIEQILRVRLERCEQTGMTSQTFNVAEMKELLKLLSSPPREGPGQAADWRHAYRLNINGFRTEVDRELRRSSPAALSSPPREARADQQQQPAEVVVLNHLWDIAGKFPSEFCNAVRDPIHMLNVRGMVPAHPGVTASPDDYVLFKGEARAEQEQEPCPLLSDDDSYSPSNPYVAPSCWTKFDTYEEMSHHERKHKAAGSLPALGDRGETE